MCSIDPDFPPHLWCRLIQKSDMTLNMLHAARMNPKILAYELLEGHFDYNIPPLASHGRKVIIHKKLQQKKSWARMEIRPGTLDQHFNITGATGCISQRHAMIV